MSYGPLSMKTVLGKTTGTKPQYDYDHQAWTVINAAGFRVYVRCGHPTPCDCYGRKHEGEPANLKLQR